jgi:hypothetical protein
MGGGLVRLATHVISTDRNAALLSFFQRNHSFACLIRKNRLPLQRK